MQIDLSFTELCPLQLSHQSVCPYAMLQICATNYIHIPHAIVMQLDKCDLHKV